MRWKQDSGQPYISYNEGVDQLMCFGWVDSHIRRFDEKRSMLLISPRNPKSNWSASNKARVTKMSKECLMAPSGLAAVKIVKDNGTWVFLNDIDQLIQPPDLVKALKNTGKAAFYFNRFPDSSKRGILEWIKMVKKKETRAKRIQETAKLAAKNLKANHPKDRNKGPNYAFNSLVNRKSNAPLPTYLCSFLDVQSKEFKF